MFTALASPSRTIFSAPRIQHGQVATHLPGWPSCDGTAVPRLQLDHASLGEVDQQEYGTELLRHTYPIHWTSLPFTVALGLAALRMVHATGLDIRPCDSDVSVGVLMESPSRMDTWARRDANYQMKAGRANVPVPRVASGREFSADSRLPLALHHPDFDVRLVLDVVLLHLLVERRAVDAEQVGGPLAVPAVGLQRFEDELPFRSDQ